MIKKTKGFLASLWIETIPNIVRWIKCDENLSLYVIVLRGLRGIKELSKYGSLSNATNGHTWKI